MARVIPNYNGEADSIHHIQKHESSHLGKTSDDNQFALLFPATLIGNISYWFFGRPRASVTYRSDINIKFIHHYMGELQLLKNFGYLDDVRQGIKESLASYYNNFKKNLVDIDQVISMVEVDRVFIKGLGPKGTAIKDCHQIILIYNLEERSKRMKAYIHFGKVEGTSVSSKAVPD